MQLSDNEKTLFSLVRRRPGIVRGELASYLSISRSAVDLLVKSLVAKGLIIEKTTGAAKSGRRPVPIEVNSKGKFSVIGVEISDGDKIEAAKISLDGRIIKRSSTNIPDAADNEIILKSLKKTIDSLLGRNNSKKEKILGIGVGIVGLVDSNRGVCLSSSLLNACEDLLLEPFLSEAYDLPVFIQDISRAKCLAELQFGVARAHDSFLFIEYGDAVGLGIYSDGKLYAGERGAGSEFGHMVIELDGPFCGCGGRGCLEAVCGGKAVATKAREAIANGAASSIITKAGSLEAINADHVFSAAMENDRLALNLVDEAIKKLGTAIGGICNIFNPPLLVLGGELAKYPELWAPIKFVVRKVALPQVSEGMAIEFSTLNDDQAILGAGDLVIENIMRGNDCK